MLSPRYSKFVLALAGAIGTLIIVLVEQNANLIPREWHPYVMFAYSLAVAFGVRQIPNRPGVGERPRPDMSEQDKLPEGPGTPVENSRSRVERRLRDMEGEGGYGALETALAVLAVLCVVFLLLRYV